MFIKALEISQRLCIPFEVPTVNFVLFPVVQTLTSRPLRNALYQSYCYVNETVANSVSGGTPAAAAEDGLEMLPQKGLAAGKNLARDSVRDAIRSIC